MPAQISQHDNEANGPFFLGVDVGGTNIKIGLIDDQGRTLAFESIITNDGNGANAAIERAGNSCRELAKRAGIGWRLVPRVGLGTPGPLSREQGKLLNPSNLPGWHYFPVQAALEKAVGKPVSYVNDANAAALGECWIGAGAGQSSLAFVTLGTGVGGGFISEGRLINGVNSFGSEIGHIVVDSREDARLCVWGGGRGQLEAYASASAVAAQANLGVRSGVESSLCKVASKLNEEADGDQLTAKHVHEAALEGDSFALELIDEAAFYLGIGVTCAVHVIDPGLVLLGGAMNFGGASCVVGQRFLRRIVSEFKERTFANVFEGTHIDFARLGSDAGYIGAAAMARQDYYQNIA